MKNAVVALGRVEWESELLSALAHPMIGLKIQRRCVDGVDVHSAVQVVDVDVVILSDQTLRVDANLISHLRDQGIELLVITAKPENWQELGVENLVMLNPARPMEALSAITSFLRKGNVPQVVDVIPQGDLIAVVGFGGATGRTSCLREVGWQSASKGIKTLLVDGDTYGASLHQELGLDATSSGLLELCRAHETRKLNTESVAEFILPIADNLDFASGIFKSSRWTDLRVPALRGVWQQVRSSYQRVLVDLGPVLEIDQSLIHESALPRRHAVALTALEHATKIILCARADEIGVSRLVRGFLEFSELFTDSQVNVVLWGTNDKDKSYAQAVARHTGLTSITQIPYDRVLARKASSLGQAVCFLDPKSKIALGYAELNESLNRDDTGEKAQSRLARIVTRNQRAA